MKKEYGNYSKHRKEMKRLFDSFEIIVHLIKEGKTSSSEYNNEIIRNNLTDDDVKEIEDIAKGANEDEYVERLSRLTTRVYFRKKFKGTDDFKKVVYEMLTNKTLSLNPDTLHHYIHIARNKVGLYGNVADDVYDFLMEIQRMQNSSEIYDTIVAEFEGKNYVAPSYGRGKGTGRGDAPRVDEPTRMNVSAVEILRKYRDRFAELNNFINSEKKYFVVISKMLENKIFPESKEGQALLKSVGLREDIVKEYIDILNRITIALSINDNVKEITAFIRGLSNSEFEFIADLESENLTLDDQEGMQMLSERCVNRGKIEQFYKYLKENKIKEKRQLIDLENKQLADMFNKLNIFEKSLIEDMIAETITCYFPDDPKKKPYFDQEGEMMLSERCVDRDNIIAYFKLREKIDQDIKDANDLGESLKPKKTEEKSPENLPKTDPKKEPEKTPEKGSDDKPVKLPEKNPEKNPEKGKDDKKVINKESFFKRVGKFFGNLFKKKEEPKKTFETPMLDRLKGYKMRNLDEYDDELQRMNNGGRGR